MRVTLACKKRSVGIIYIILSVVGIAMLISGISDKNYLVVVCGVIFAIMGAVLSVQYLLLPSNIIILSDGVLILPKGVTVSLDSISDVSYRRASASGIRYRWGSITISTYHGVYKYGFVADCEAVSKRLTQLVYEAKRKTEEANFMEK